MAAGGGPAAGGVQGGDQSVHVGVEVGGPGAGEGHLAEVVAPDRGPPDHRGAHDDHDALHEGVRPLLDEGVDERDPGDPLGRVPGELDDRRPGVGLPDQDGPLDAEVVEQGEDVGGDGRGAVVVPDDRGLAEAPQVHGDDPAPGGREQRVQVPVGAAGVEHPGEQDDGGAGALPGVVVREAAAGDVEVLGARGDGAVHGGPPRARSLLPIAIKLRLIALAVNSPRGGPRPVERAPLRPPRP